MRIIGAPRKYSPEIGERATRLAVEARQDPASRRGSMARIADQLGIHREALETALLTTRQPGNPATLEAIR